MKKTKKNSTRVHTYVPVGTGYRMIPGTAVCSKESMQRRTAQHRRARHGTVQHRTALRCAAEL